MNQHAIGLSLADWVAFQMNSLAVLSAVALFLITMTDAAGQSLEVWRLQQQRDQQQMELQLRMQQQQNRDARPAAATLDVQRDLAQQQRLRALHEKQTRAATVLPPDPPATPADASEQARRALEAQRAERERLEFMQRQAY